ncbi:hypothetical protein [Streptomyces sp. NPDC060198]|uniref:hypothetical protein n=1 Tax=Streptomyces sp. NPDC060198 TaxID=3347070 RepID=UPI0036478C4C
MGGERGREVGALLVLLEVGRVGERQELRSLGGDLAVDGRTHPRVESRDVLGTGRRAERPRRDELHGLGGERLGLAAAAARLAEPAGPGPPAFLARQCLMHRLGDGSGLALQLCPLPGGGTGRFALGFPDAGFLAAPYEVLRVEGCLGAQPLFDGLAAGGVIEAGQLLADLGRDPGTVARRMWSTLAQFSQAAPVSRRVLSSHRGPAHV